MSSIQGTAEAVKAWLRDRGAESIDHPGGTLYTHLARVHDRLGVLGHGSDVQLAGLAHAAYGTDGFTRALLPVGERPVLRDLVGPTAEKLIYRYGACDRDRTWAALAETRQVWNRFTGHAEHPGAAELRPFVDLSIVNELDVAEHDAEVRRRYGGYFRDLFASWAPLASPPVVAEAERVLA
jgi:hypothetical protein